MRNTAYRNRARSMVARALKRGDIKKEKCSRCGGKSYLEAHHPDYSKPLEVVWFCRKHHREFHAKTKPVSIKGEPKTEKYVNIRIFPKTHALILEKKKDMYIMDVIDKAVENYFR